MFTKIRTGVDEGVRCGAWSHLKQTTSRITTGNYDLSYYLVNITRKFISRQGRLRGFLCNEQVLYAHISWDRT